MSGGEVHQGETKDGKEKNCGHSELLADNKM